jgi:uroporphyrinogen decarboxylase
MPQLDLDIVELTPNFNLEAFWLENERCLEFTTDKPRCSLSLSPDDHWLFEFLQVPSTLRYYQDKAHRDALHREANRYLQQYIGRPFFDEDTWQYTPKRIENLFGCEFEYHEGSTPWLVPVTDDPAEFARVLDRAEATDLTTWSFPEEFLQEWDERKREGKPLPLLGTGSRGPATIMSSVLKPDTLFYWIYDHPELAERFRDLLAEKMVAFNKVLREFSHNHQAGWWITDDNSALFNRKLYRQFCYPVLARVLEALAPGDARRYQHSDSSMGHLLDYQYELGIRAVNYGPEVDAGLIREKMPEAMINGQLPPFLLRNGSLEDIRQRVIDDFHKAGATGGLNVTTAGSLAAGTSLGRVRWLMWVVQEDCRYDGRPTG